MATITPQFRIAGLAILGMVIAFVAYHLAQKYETGRFTETFQEIALERLLSVETRLSAELKTVQDTAGFMRAAPFSDRNSFRSYVATETDDAMHAIEWVPRVFAEERDALEKRAREEGLTDFTFTERNEAGETIEALDREEYFPIYFAEPLDENRDVLGFDLASDPERLAALEQARDTGSVVASSRVELIRLAESDRGGILLFAPVYARGWPVDTLEQRRIALTGFALMVLRINRLLTPDAKGKDLSVTMDSEIDLFLFDASAENGPGLLTSQTTHRGQAGQPWPPQPSMLESGIHLKDVIGVGGRDWWLYAVPSQGSLNAKTLVIPTLSALAAAALCWLIGAYLFIISQQSERVRKLVVERTEELDRVNLQLIEREERTRAILDSALDGIITINQRGQIETFNPAAADIFGYVAEDMINNNVKMLMPDPDRTNHDAYLQRYIDTGEAKILGIGREVEGLRANGDVFPMSLSISEGGSADKRFFTGIVRDVTDQKRRENDLRDAREQLEARVLELQDAQERIERDAAAQLALAEDLSIAKNEAEAATLAKSEFLASMSHEIRTPMTAVMGFSDLLLDENLPESSREKVGKIKDATRSLLTIINDILDISKMEAGKLEIESIDFHLPTLVHGVIELFGAQRRGTREKSVALKSNLSTNFPDGMCGDPTRLRQVLVNLIGNAMKFTEEGKVMVEGWLIGEQSAQPMIKIAITDTGIGIPEDTIRKLFSDFTQADASITRKFQGTGLGLSICRRLIEVQGGEIGVTSSVGKGSTFWFTLPYKPAVGDVRAGTSISDNDVTRFKSKRSLNILIAEDTPMNQQILRAIIEGFGHTVDMADNGREMVEHHRHGSYDVILSDVRMPEMSGPDATRVIRALGDEKASIPIIALTADVMEESKRSYIDAGMDGIAAKPVVPSELVAVIDKVMGEVIHYPATAADPGSSAPEEPAAANANGADDNGGGEAEEHPKFEAATAAAKLGLPEEAVAKLLISFADRYGGVVEQIRTELSEDRETAQRTAHSLKGLSGTLRIHEVAAVARAVESAIENGEDDATEKALDDLAALMPVIVSDIRETIAAA